MRAKYLSVLLVALAVIIGIFFLNRPDPVLTEEPDSHKPARTEVDQTPFPGYIQEQASPMAWRLGAAGSDTREDLRIIHSLLFQLRSNVRELASQPMGTNAEFTAALTGDNRLGLIAIYRDHPSINASGELTDRWGTAIFFHAESSVNTRLRSAGPDRVMWTDDDIVYPARS